jgi:peptidoglycan/LPS O-acetylase OafA/YrhL
MAVLIVVGYHAGGGAQSANSFVRAIGFLVQAGWSGVTLFFVLSGFLITGILWDTRESAGWLKNFYLRRSLRIFPLYYATLLIVLSAAFAAHRGLACLSHIWIFALYLQNTPFFTHLAGTQGSPLRLSHFWSLAVEEQFYLIWPFLILRMNSLLNARNLCLTTFAVSFCFRLILWNHAADAGDFEGFLLTRAGELAAGGFLAIAFRDKTWKDVDRFALPAAFASIVGFLGISLVNGNLRLHGLMALGFALPCMTIFWAAVLVVSLRPGGIVNRIMTMGWLRWVGGISYGIYVFHALLMSLYPWLGAIIWPSAGRIQALALNAVLMVVVSVPLAWASFRFFETPFLRMRARFSDVRRPAVPLPASEENQALTGAPSQPT